MKRDVHESDITLLCFAKKNLQSQTHFKKIGHEVVNIDSDILSTTSKMH